MSSFNSQHNSVPITVTPILPSLLLSSPVFLAPSPHLFLPLGLTWTNTHQHTHTYFIPPSSTPFLVFSKVLPLLHLCQNCFFFVFLFFCRVHAFKVNSRTVKKFSLLCCGYHVTWIDFSRDVSDHILSLWRFPPRVSCFALQQRPFPPCCCLFTSSRLGIHLGYFSCNAS